MFTRSILDAYDYRKMTARLVLTPCKTSSATATIEDVKDYSRWITERYWQIGRSLGLPGVPHLECSDIVLVAPGVTVRVRKTSGGGVQGAIQRELKITQYERTLSEAVGIVWKKLLLASGFVGKRPIPVTEVEHPQPHPSA